MKKTNAFIAAILITSMLTSCGGTDTAEMTSAESTVSETAAATVSETDTLSAETTATSLTFTNAVKQDTEVTTEFVFGVVAEQGAEESDLTNVTTVPNDLVPDLPVKMTTVATTVFDRNKPIKFIDAAILRVTSDYSWLDKVDKGFVVCMDVTMDDIPDFVVVNTATAQTIYDIDAYMVEAYSLKDMHSYGEYLDNEYLSLWSEYIQPDGVHVKYSINDYSNGITVLEVYNRWEMDFLDTIMLTEVGVYDGETWIHDGAAGTMDEYEAFTQTVYGSYEYVPPRDYIKGATIEALKEMSEEERYINISLLFGDYAGKYEVPELSAIWE